jgi:hypothetical protein
MVSVLDVDGRLTNLSFYLPFAVEGFEFTGRVDGVRDKFPKKNLLIGVKELFYDGEDVLGLYRYVSFLHNRLIFSG